jgi:DNA-directed RNA polymerase I and III subunit RPAC1
VFRLAVNCTKPKVTKNKKGEEDLSRVTVSNTPDQSVGDIDVVDQAAEDAASNYHGNLAAVETPGRPYTKHIYSGDLQWVPQGDQEDRFPNGGIRPVHEDILLAKLRPGQTIELEAHARLGDGKDHGKYSPVATACYRLMPVIELLEDVYDELADELDLCEPGVFDIVPTKEGGHLRKAVLKNPYACTMSRNFMRNPVLKKAVKLTRRADHFIFSIEAVGMLPAATILAESLKVLKDKCQNTIRLADEDMENELLK